jgi:hypothetical protein
MLQPQSRSREACTSSEFCVALSDTSPPAVTPRQAPQLLEFRQFGCLRLRLRFLVGTENNVAASFKNFVRQNHRSRDKGGTHVGVCHCKSYDQRYGSVRGLQKDAAANNGEVWRPNWLRAAAPLFSRESGRANG